MEPSEKMSRAELRATLSLAAIYGLSMLGMFLILPIFAIYAEGLQGGTSHTAIGIAMGAYGLMQMLFFIPFGLASDHFGRKKIIYLGLGLFVVGSAIAAMATNINTVILGRAIQGAGAFSAVVSALVADLTREEHRTKAMAMIGGTIAVTFAISLVAGPILNKWIGVPGIFWLTAILGLAAMGVIKFIVPDTFPSHFHSDVQTAPNKIKSVLGDTQLLRLNFGTFCLHGAQMAMFVVVPFALKNSMGLGENQHWQVYLPVLIASFLLMVPAIIVGEKRAKLKPVFVGAVGLMLVAQACLALSVNSTLAHNGSWGLIAALLIYFTAFNILEASLPSLISKMAPVASKGTAIGVHNSARALGASLGAVMGGYLSQHYGQSLVFWFCAGLMLLWLLFSLTMQTPPSVKTKIFRANLSSEAAAKALTSKIAQMAGVQEVVALVSEGTLMVKFNTQQSIEQQATLAQNISTLIGSN